MAVVHASFVALMSRLVQKNGRDVFIRRDTGATPVDVARPWLGDTPEAEDTPHRVVFLDNDSRDLIVPLPGRPDERTSVTREIDRLVIVPRVLPDGTDLPFELDVVHRLVDAGKVWELTNIIRLKPGPTLIGWFARVSV